jgi:glycerol-3-phosphate acyltransferase PlsY
MPNAAPPPEWLVPAVVFAAYAWGSLSPGWWLVRQKAGVDLRSEGSGATGATNVSRILGRKAYAWVLVLDTLKGWLAVLGARWLAPASPWAALAAPAVVAGHIWPVWLRFRGGRGAATLMGDCFALHWAIVPLAWVPGFISVLFIHKWFIARSIAFVCSLPIGWWLLGNFPSRMSLLIGWLLVLLAHRDHFGK